MKGQIRDGQAKPWKYGPYRVVIQRRVTEEEQISVECYEADRETAQETFDLFMAAMNAHRLNYNENIVMVSRGKLAQLDRLIDGKADEIRQLDEAIEQRRLWLREHGVTEQPPPFMDQPDEGNGCAPPEDS